MLHSSASAAGSSGVQGAAVVAGCGGEVAVDDNGKHWRCCPGCLELRGEGVAAGATTGVDGSNRTFGVTALRNFSADPGAPLSSSKKAVRRRRLVLI